MCALACSPRFCNVVYGEMRQAKQYDNNNKHIEAMQSMCFTWRSFFSAIV